jgi:hypothetical protein
MELGTSLQIARFSGGRNGRKRETMKLHIENERAILHTRPSPRLMAVLPSLEGRRQWLKEGGLRIEPTGHNIERLREAFPDLVVSEAPGASPGAEEFDRPSPTHYVQRTQPYDHQIRALDKVRTQPAFALFMEQGTGKTKVAIDRAGELWAAGKITGVLVVAKKGVHRQWIESQIPEHFGGEWSGMYWQNGKWVDAEPGEGLVWRAINFDGAKTDKGFEACEQFVKAHYGKIMIIADETQEIKNAKSARHVAIEQIKRLSGSPYRLALTGTPIAKDLTDEWAQMRWLDERILGIKYVTAFRNEYCIMGGYEGREVIAHKNVDRFKAKVDPFTFRATKDELGILPKAYRVWRFDLSAEQKRIIRGLRQELISQIDSGEIVSAATAAVAVVKIQQVSNGFVIDEDGDTRMLHPNPRLDALMEILEAYDGKTIIWARFRQDIANVAQELRDRGIGVVEYHGGTADKARADNVQKFLHDPDTRIFLSNPQAGGTGLNLQGECRHAIYYSNSFNAIDRWQSEDRIHRIGTKGQVVYTDLVAKGSIDAGILGNLRRKKGISEMALGDIRSMLDDDFV